jgi:hypothetical protein
MEGEYVFQGQPYHIPSKKRLFQPMFEKARHQEQQEEYFIIHYQSTRTEH